MNDSRNNEQGGPAKKEFFLLPGRVTPARDPGPPWRQNLQFGAMNTDWSDTDANKMSEKERANIRLIEKEIGEHKWWMSLLPGGIYTTVKMFGGSYLLRTAFNMLSAYVRTSVLLKKKYGWSAFWKFWGTKILTPVGEGAGAGAFFLAGPLIRKFPALAPFPRYAEIEMTTICNKRCTHCEHTHWGHTQEQRHLSIEEYRHIIDQFDLTWVHTTGEGSSFLNPDFFKIIEENRKRNIPHYFVDHFNDMTEKEMDKILDLDVAGIYISIDGASSKTYNPVRIGCDFDRVIANIRRFIAKKIARRSDLPELNFRMVVTRDNMHEMPQFVELVKSFGGGKIIGRGARIDFVGVLNFGENENGFVETIPIEVYKETIARAKNSDLNIIFSHIEPTQNPPSSQCICWLEPYILMGGDVIPCCTVLMSNNREYLHSHSFGNLFAQTFREVWDTPRFKEFRRIINDDSQPVPGFCVNCRGYDNTRRALKNGIRWDL
ncbi:MAG: radical SAM protein [Candidatus Ozemobacteraceae bacterium]